MMTPPMSIAAAREILRGSQAFVKEAGDIMWAALLSLENAEELVAVASRLDWRFHPRGMNNTDLHRRYGDGIVPWLATRLDADGVLHNLPWCVVPCLLACDGQAAFDLVWKVRRVDGSPMSIARAWLDRHPVTGAAYLDALAGDRRAAAHRRGLAFRGLAEAPPARTADEILAVLDACALRLVAGAAIPWPAVEGTGPRAPRDFRAVAARDGDDWGLAIERVEGERASGVYAARTAVFAYGSRVARGWAISARAGTDLGAPEQVLPALGMAGGRIVAVVPQLAHVDGQPTLPSESGVYRAIAAALAA